MQQAISAIATPRGGSACYAIEIGLKENAKNLKTAQSGNYQTLKDAHTGTRVSCIFSFKVKTTSSIDPLVTCHLWMKPTLSKSMELKICPSSAHATITSGDTSKNATSPYLEVMMGCDCTLISEGVLFASTLVEMESK